MVTLPFGLCNAPSTFERLVENVLSGLTYQLCLVYLDDIIVFGSSFEQKLENLNLVFLRMRKANLKLNPDKCDLFKTKVKFLGHIVSSQGISTDPEKVKAIKDWPQPSCIKQVRSFLGICSYYRKFIANFSHLARPLNKLLEKDTPFKWTDECTQAFEILKQKLIEAPILGYPQNGDQFILDTDASNFGIGGVLSQVQNGQERVIGYYSKSLNKAERSYCVTRKELLALVMSVRHFHCYLYGRPFKLTMGP